MSIAMICMFSGCSENSTQSPHSSDSQNATENNDTEKQQNDYSIVERDGKCYIVFDDAPKIEGGSHFELASLTFESIADLRDSVLNKKLTDWQKQVVATAFRKDENGILTCDFDRMYVPIIPDGFETVDVDWSGESYSFYIESLDETFGFVYLCTEALFEERFRIEYETFFERDTITVNETNEMNGKTVVDFSTTAGEFRKVRYTVEDKGIIVDMTYQLKSNYGSMSVSETIPTDITLFCNTNDVYYVVDLYDLAEPMDASTILQFGIQPYVGNEKVK